jgi:protein transport protein SEC13
LEKDLKHNDWVRDVAWAPNIGIPYDMIATCSQDGRVFIWKKAESEQTWKETSIPLFDIPHFFLIFVPLKPP